MADAYSVLGSAFKGEVEVKGSVGASMVTKRRNVSKDFTIRYRSICFKCNGKIKVGSWVRLSHGGGVQHSECVGSRRIRGDK